MSHIIAIAGKGGTGKTTIAALLVRIIKEKKLGSILAIDADPNSNLGEYLGVPAAATIGTILDGISGNPGKIPAGMTKERFIQYEVQTAVAESEGFDLLTMGRPEGPGCYCYVNNVLRNVAAKLIGEYDYVIIDNEAGLEHFSRRTTRSADSLVIVSDASSAGLRAVRRINDLVGELKIKINRAFLMINRFSEDLPAGKLSGIKPQYLGFIPQDPEIESLSQDGGSVFDLKNNAVSVISLRKLGERIWN